MARPADPCRARRADAPGRNCNPQMTSARFRFRADARALSVNSVSVNTAAVGPPHMRPAHMAPFGKAYDGFINDPRSRSPLLLQPRIISRRRRDGRRRGTCRHHRGPAAERHRSGDGAACVKSFHIVPPGADAADACVAADAKFAADDRDFKASQRDQRICSGVSLGEPLPLASALLISVTMRRDNGTCSPCLSAMAVMTPCR